MFKYTLAATLDEMDREGITVAECPLRSMRCLSLENGRIVGINDINLVVPPICISEKSVLGELHLDEALMYGSDDTLYFHSIHFNLSARP